MALYTYHLGERLPLTFSPTRFVSRATAQRLREQQLNPVERLSPHSHLVDAPRELESLIRRAQRLGAPAFLDYRNNDSGERVGVTDRFFVRFRQRMRTHAAREFAATHRMAVIREYDDKDYLFRMTDAQTDPVSVVVNVTEQRQSPVESISHDVNFKARLAVHRSLDPGCEQQWYLKGVGGTGSVDAEDAWNKLESTGSPNVVIGVIDAGFDVQNPEFSNDKFAGWAFVLDGKLFTRESLSAEAIHRMASDTAHGTKCAIAAAAEINGFGGAGVAPQCRLYPVNCEHRGGFIDMCPSKFMSIVETIGGQVDVISCSWDLGPEQIWPDVTQDFIRKAIANGGRRRKGIVFVWAAGNDNRPINSDTRVDVPYAFENVAGQVQVRTTRRFRNPIAAIDGVVHVGAVSSELERCHYSNYGAGLTLCAPGSNDHTYDRENIGLRGQRFVLPDLAADFSGTSASTAIVSGVAALVISANPDLTAKEVVSILKNTASKQLKFERYPPYTPPGESAPVPWDVSPVEPFDRGEFRDVGDVDGTWSPWFGWGKVEASKAVEAARQRKQN